jgi:hypothetical protein
MRINCLTVRQTLNPPLCITGAHRSGTSMVAHLLYRCGVDLGPESELMPAATDNLEGFWENQSFVSINDALLHSLGGSWDLPVVATPARLSRNTSIPKIKSLAAKLLSRFDDTPLWGWKDPRNCLTLPFWQELLPRMKILLIVRNPLEMARSLNARNGLSHTFSYNLWSTYNRAVIKYAAADTLVVADYNALFEDAASELTFLMQSLGLRTDHVWRATEIISYQARHHRQDGGSMRTLGVPKKIVSLYEFLLRKHTSQRGERLAMPLP